MALEARDAGELERALESLETLEQEYARTPQGRRAPQEIAYTTYLMGDYGKAIELANTQLSGRTQLDEETVGYLLYLRASATHGLWDEYADSDSPALARLAFARYRELVEAQPESEWAETSMRRMNTLRADLAAHELERARAAMETGAFAEAAERAAWVAEQYRGSRAAGDALALQTNALQRMGRTGEADATHRMLQIMYPDHPMAR